MDQYFSFSPHLHIQTGVGSKTVPTMTLENLHEEIVLMNPLKNPSSCTLDKLRNDKNEIKVLLKIDKM